MTVLGINFIPCIEYNELDLNWMFYRVSLCHIKGVVTLDTVVNRSRKEPADIPAFSVKTRTFDYPQTGEISPMLTYWCNEPPIGLQEFRRYVFNVLKPPSYYKVFKRSFGQVYYDEENAIGLTLELNRTKPVEGGAWDWMDIMEFMADTLDAYAGITEPQQEVVWNEQVIQ